MDAPQVILDTNVVVSALRSNLGSSFRLLSLVGQGEFEINLSVPLVLEYEEVCKRLLNDIPLDVDDIEAIIDFLCSVARLHEIYFLWRPLLRDPKDDMVLELAVTSQAEFIVTFNTTDFEGAEQFGVSVVTPTEFLREIGEIR